MWPFLTPCTALTLVLPSEKSVRSLETFKTYMFFIHYVVQRHRNKITSKIICINTNAIELLAEVNTLWVLSSCIYFRLPTMGDINVGLTKYSL
jgi:hypothetical protein